MTTLLLGKHGHQLCTIRSYTVWGPDNFSPLLEGACLSEVPSRQMHQMLSKSRSHFLGLSSLGLATLCFSQKEHASEIPSSLMFNKCWACERLPCLVKLSTDFWIICAVLHFLQNSFWTLLD